MLPIWWFIAASVAWLGACYLVHRTGRNTDTVVQVEPASDAGVSHPSIEPNPYDDGSCAGCRYDTEVDRTVVCIKCTDQNNLYSK